MRHPPLQVPQIFVSPRDSTPLTLFFLCDRNRGNDVDADDDDDDDGDDDDDLALPLLLGKPAKDAKPTWSSSDHANLSNHRLENCGHSLLRLSKGGSSWYTSAKS